MRRFRGIGFAVVVAMLCAAPAQATPPRDASTTAVIHTFQIVDQREADGNIFRTVRTTATYTGTWNGFATTEFEVLLQKTGWLHVRGVVICQCTVDGQSGILTLDVRYAFDPDSQLQNSSWVIHGSEGLENLHGQGSLEWLPGFRYVGQYHFDP